MKKLIANGIIVLIFMMIGNINVTAQNDKPYKEGTVWIVQYVHTKSGMQDQYLKNLSEGWVKQMKAAKEQGLVLDYKIMTAPPSFENDWDLMLMYEIKNFATLDNIDEKMDALNKRLFGSKESMEKAAISRNDIRVLQGSKLVRELVF